MAKKLTFTKEDVLVSVSTDEYEKGDFVLSSIHGRKLGKIKVTDYRRLKKKPYKEPLTYLAQLTNCFWVGWNVIGKILFLSPIVYFWFLIAALAYGGIGLRGASIIDLYSPALLTVSVFLTGLPICISAMFRSKYHGYTDLFEKRFHHLLEQEVPVLKDVDKYNLNWAVSQ